MNSLGRACMSHLINRQQICCKRGHIEYILELTMLDFNRTSPNIWYLRVISQMNLGPLERFKVVKDSMEETMWLDALESIK